MIHDPPPSSKPDSKGERVGQFCDGFGRITKDFFPRVHIRVLFYKTTLCNFFYLLFSLSFLFPFSFLLSCFFLAAPQIDNYPFL
jgi:hypothetical protein